MNRSTAPIVTLSNPFSMTQLPSHNRSCGQIRPQISGKVLVALADLIRLLQPVLRRQLQPVRDVVRQRAMDLAERHAALAAPAGLRPRLRRVEILVDLGEVLAPGRGTARFSGCCCGRRTNCSMRSAMAFSPFPADVPRPFDLYTGRRPPVCKGRIARYLGQQGYCCNSGFYAMTDLARRARQERWPKKVRLRTNPDLRPASPPACRHPRRYRSRYAGTTNSTGVGVIPSSASPGSAGPPHYPVPASPAGPA